MIKKLQEDKGAQNLKGHKIRRCVKTRGSKIKNPKIKGRKF